MIKLTGLVIYYHLGGQFMKHTSYTISDAAKKMSMETHVLRYWEEELNLEIPRNELGHRCYRDKDIQVFTHIKKLKEEGFSLHDIRTVIPKLTRMTKLEPSFIEKMKKDLPSTALRTSDTSNTSMSGSHSSSTAVAGPDSDKLGKFREIMGSIISQAITNNNEQLASMICDNTSERIMKEMNYLFRTLDEDEEVRLNQLEAAVNAAIGVKREIAATGSPTKEKKHHFRKRNGKKNT